MGINASIDGDIRQELVDPKGLVNWLLSLPTIETTACLRFVDPYGQTMFNRLQLPVVQEELKALRSVNTPKGLGPAKKRFLDGGWISADELSAHLERLISLVSDCIAQGPHHVGCLIGD